MPAQYCFQQLRHVMVGSVDFVDHEQAAIKTNRAEVGVRNLHGGQQHLVDRSYSDGSSEKALRMLSGPAALSVLKLPIIVPPIGNLFIGEEPARWDAVYLSVSW